MKKYLILILIVSTFISCDNNSQRKSDFKRKVMHSKLVFPYNEDYGLFFSENGDNLQFRGGEQDMNFSFYKLIGEKDESIGIYTNNSDYYFIIGIINNDLGEELLSAYMRNVNNKDYKGKFVVSDYEAIFYDKNIVANIATNEAPIAAKDRQEIAFDKKSNKWSSMGKAKNGQEGFESVFEYGSGPDEHGLQVYVVQDGLFAITDWSYNNIGFYSINLIDNKYSYGGNTYKLGYDKKAIDTINKLEYFLKIIHRQDGNTKQIKIAKDVILEARKKLKMFDIE